ncbi:FAD-dependent monooxygenase [Variovorax sp. J22P271]|uniref:NAD(P)/FAD-dependent oxidoreductase n=1 Tax=Variovorax davisae TaxID=3053515 RepID=UPI002574ECE0|nr:FAD-dependent monooxygenase [Variovorax sp. J22P271]MDM0036016.1 FAD-dependent monooxygenase [Variovorax sp. J22P271]
MTLSAASNACEVLVIGAGPAGSACAQVLPAAGLDVLLVDQQAFPRDKTCGDGLIPDAQRALARLGLLDAVLARARVATHVGWEPRAAAGSSCRRGWRAYAQANRINEHPWLVDLVIWRARRSRRLAHQLAEVLEESRSPGPLGSAGGLLQLLLPLGGPS